MNFHGHQILLVLQLGPSDIFLLLLISNLLNLSVNLRSRGDIQIRRPVNRIHKILNALVDLIRNLLPYKIAGNVPKPIRFLLQEFTVIPDIFAFTFEFHNINQRACQENNNRNNANL